jgi:hypothetical protein
MKKLANLEFAPQDEVERRRVQMDKLLSVLGHSEAWVSDKSWLGDFAFGMAEEDIIELIFCAYDVRISLDWFGQPLYKLLDFLERPKTYGFEN